MFILMEKLYQKDKKHQAEGSKIKAGIFIGNNPLPFKVFIKTRCYQGMKVGEIRKKNSYKYTPGNDIFGASRTVEIVINVQVSQQAKCNLCEIEWTTSSFSAWFLPGPWSPILLYQRLGSSIECYFLMLTYNSFSIWVRHMQ